MLTWCDHVTRLAGIGNSGSSSWRRVRGQLVEGGRSLVAFFCGLLLASLYGLTALLVQKQPLWQSAYTTVGVAFLAAFGLGLCSGVRDDVLVLLPTLCSGQWSGR